MRWHKRQQWTSQVREHGITADIVITKFADKRLGIVWHVDTPAGESFAPSLSLAEAKRKSAEAARQIIERMAAARGAR